SRWHRSKLSSLARKRWRSFQARRRNRLFRPEIQILEPRQLLAVVSVEATDPLAAETGADSGTFTISRTGDTSQQLEVYFYFGGSAMEYSDYYASHMSSVTIPMGSSSATVSVYPQSDS